MRKLLQWNLKADTYGFKNFVRFREVLLILTKKVENSVRQSREPIRLIHIPLLPSPVKGTYLKD